MSVPEKTNFRDTGVFPTPFVVGTKTVSSKAWASGSVKGLRARGGFTVDIAWQDGRVTNYRLRSKEPRPATVRVNGETKRCVSETFSLAPAGE